MKFHGDAVLEGQKRAQVKYVEEIYLKIYRDNPDLLEGEQIQALIAFQDKLRQKQNILKMITIGFPPEVVDACVVEPYMSKFLSKKWIPNNHLYVYEYHGKEGKRIHIHFLALMTKARSEIINETYNTFKDIIQGKNNVDVRCYKSDQLPNLVKYLTNNDDKKKDVKWRKVQGLRPFYGTLSSP